MWNQVRHQGATDKANKKYFQRRIPTQTEKYLKHNKWKFRYSNERDQKIKNKPFWFKTKPRIHGRYTGAKTGELKISEWEAQS